MANVDQERLRAVSKETLHGLMAEAAESGRYDLPRREGSDHVTPIDGVTATIMTRLDSYRRDADGRIVNVTDPWFLTEAEMAGRRQALEYARFLRDRVPGYEHASLVALGTQIGVRETRRVYGDARLTGEDVPQPAPSMTGSGCAVPPSRTTIRRRHDLAVPARRRRGRHPYGSLVVRDASRCSWPAGASRRPTTPTPRCGAWPSAWRWARRRARRRQAVATGRDPREIDVATLRARLRVDGAIIELADAPGVESTASTR
jgi:hypothetical protein